MIKLIDVPKCIVPECLGKRVFCLVCKQYNCKNHVVINHLYCRDRNYDKHDDHDH
jgi:hypothetical protein